ncbi:MAG TPA: FUSC family protein [Propionibacteriaceae bacterium]|nr:FUSC family protein [Propionibacteriaceae bacterium]
MDSEAFSLQRVKLRASDLSDRTIRLGRASTVRRGERWRQRAFMIIQCSVTAGFSWWLASKQLGHQVPYFAAVASILVLGMAYGQRLRRGVDVAIGVSVGVALGDLWLALFGAGLWQLILVCALAMSLATLLGAGSLMTTQAGAQSIAVVVLAPSLGYGVHRWLDAVIGCALALLVATVAPNGPLRKPGEVAAKVVAGMAETLDAAAQALAANDEAAASAVLDRAQAAEKDLVAFDQAAAEGVAVARQSPFRRRQLLAATALADLHEPLDHASRNLRVLVRRCVVAVWRGDHVPEAYQDLIRRLAEACRSIAKELAARRLPTAARDQLREIAEISAHLQLTHSMSAVVILAQTRSMVADMMQLTGMEYVDARELIPDVD